MEQECIFCRILAGELPAHRVYEDAHTLAFMDLSPVRQGHVLVITREHASNIFECSAESLARVSATVKKIAEALRALYSPAGLMIAQLNGEAAGQTVFHYHTHLIPREEGDGTAMHSRSQGDPDELARIAGELRDYLAP